MITKRDEQFMDTVITAAISTDKVVARVSAMLVIKNKPIAFGTNQRKSHPFHAKYGKNEDAIFLHAETDAIRKALNRVSVDDLRNATLYVARAKKADNRPNSKDIQGIARPCKGCMRAVVDFGIKKVVYTTNRQGEYEVLLRS